MSVVAAGSSESGTVDLSETNTDLLKFKGNGGAATVTLNRQTIDVLQDDWLDVPGSYDGFVVASGTVDWIAFG